MTPFSAGTDTTRTTMTWVLLLCAAHPEVQVKMQDEIDRVVGKYSISYAKTWSPYPLL